MRYLSFMNTPNGYAEIDALFGNPSNADGSPNLAWQHANIVKVAPPAGWQLYYQSSATSLTPIPTMSMPHLLADSFHTVLTQVWAFAVNAIGGTPGDEAVRGWLHNLRLDITAGCSWSDGRHFPTPDPMHVQFATGA
jgi:hypothetical protein